MVLALAHRSIAGWLVQRMTLVDPQPPEVVRLVGVTILDPLLVDDSAARASWIADGCSAHDLLRAWGGEVARFDAVAAVGWPAGVPEVLAVIVNP